MNGIEIYADNFGNVMVMIDGERKPLIEVDDRTYQLFVFDMNNHPNAIAILDMMGLYTEAEQLPKYLSCRYGCFDNIPDFAHDGTINPDYYPCGNRGACKFEGKLCDKLRVKNGYLTHQEINIVQLVKEDLADKEIAGILNISINTVTTHIQNILTKVDVHSRVGICRFAIEHNI